MSNEKTLDQIFSEFTNVLNEQRRILSLEEPKRTFIPNRPTYENLDTDTSAVKFFKAVYNLHVYFHYSLALSSTELLKFGGTAAISWATSWVGVKVGITKTDLDSHTQEALNTLKKSFNSSDPTTIILSKDFKILLEELTSEKNWNLMVSNWVRNFIGDAGKAGFEFILLYFEIMLYGIEVNNQITQITTSLAEKTSLNTAKDYLTKLENELNNYLTKISALVARNAYGVTEQHLKDARNILEAKQKVINESLETIERHLKPSLEKEQKLALGRKALQKYQQSKRPTVSRPKEKIIAQIETNDISTSKPTDLVKTDSLTGNLTPRSVEDNTPRLVINTHTNNDSLNLETPNKTDFKAELLKLWELIRDFLKGLLDYIAAAYKGNSQTTSNTLTGTSQQTEHYASNTKPSVADVIGHYPPSVFASPDSTPPGDTSNTNRPQP